MANRIERAEEKLAMQQRILQSVKDKFQRGIVINAMDNGTIKAVFSKDERDGLKEYLNQSDDLLYSIFNSHNNISSGKPSVYKDALELIESKIKSANDKVSLLNLSIYKTLNPVSILKAREMLANLFSDEFLYISPKDFASEIPGLDELMQIADLPVSADEHINYLQSEHNKHQTDKRAVVVGAGPTGLMAAIKLYHQGAKVSLIESRDKDKLHTRRQTVVLDASIMADLKLYLGPRYDELFTTQGHAAKIMPDGRGNICINVLETVLYDVINSIAEKDNSNMSVFTGTEAVSIKPPANGQDNFEITLKDNATKKIYASLECDYVLSSEGTKGRFAGKTELLGEVQVANANNSAQYYTTFIYELSANGILAQNENYDRFPSIQETYLPSRFDRDLLKSSVRRIANTLSTNLNSYGVVNRNEIDLINDKIDALYHGIDDLTQPINLRNMETQGQYYVASEVPNAYAELLMKLDEIQSQQAPGSKTHLEMTLAKKEVMNAWSAFISNKHRFLRSPHVTLNHERSSTFPVTPSGLPTAARVLRRFDKELVVAAAGDLFRSPHFYSGSGISGAHAAVNAFVNYFSNMQKDATHRLDHLHQYEKAMQHVASYTDGNMNDYVKVAHPLPAPQVLAVRDVGPEEIEFDKAIQEMVHYRNRLLASKNSFWTWIFRANDLTVNKITEVDKIIEATKGLSYREIQSGLAQVNTGVLASHRFFGLGSKTTSLKCFERLAQSIDTLANEESMREQQDRTRSIQAQ